MRKSQITKAQIAFVLALERICHQVGYPQSIRVDQGSEFISSHLDLWAYQKGVVLDFSRPGKPTDACRSSICSVIAAYVRVAEML